MCIPSFKEILDFLNSQSISAFLGAFAAFMLVAINDWRRERRKVKTIRAEVQVHLADAKAKRETARRLRTGMRDENKVMPAPVLKFNTTFTRQLAGEALHHLSLDQRRAIEALCYTMEAIDGLFSESQELANKFTAPLDHANRMSTATHLLANLGDVISNLNRLIEMCETYLAAHYGEIINKQYDHSQYAEP